MGTQKKTSDQGQIVYGNLHERTKIFFFPRQGGKSESSLRRQQQKKASDLKVGHEAAAMASNERKAKQKLEQIFWRYQVAFKIIHETYYYFYQKPKNLFRLMPWKYFFMLWKTMT